MRTASDAIIRRRLVENGPQAAEMILRQEGYAPVSLNYLRELRRSMLQNGTAKRLNPGGNASSHVAADYTGNAVQASADLAEAINALYQREAKRHGCSVTAAMYKMNFSRAQLEKMAA